MGTVAAFPTSPSDAGPWGVTGDVLIARQATREAIEQRQRLRLTRLLQAARRAPYWERQLRGTDPARTALADLPVTRKPEAFAEFDARIGDASVHRADLDHFCADHGCVGTPYLGRYWVWTSSGSTGQPAIYVQDLAAMAVYDALEGTRRHSPRPWRRALDPMYWTERLAFVVATGGHFATHVSVQRLRQTAPWATNGRSFDILQPVEALCAGLNAFAPTVLATYPTAALMLAEEAAAGRLQCRPAEVWTGGETLTPAMRARIESALDTRVCNSYGASEFLPIAWECGHGRLHVNADWVILEPVDRQGRAVPAGQASHTTLLTNLANHLQPLIRLDIGDRIVLDAERCTCGCQLPVVEVQGRCDDALQLPGRTGRAVTLLPLALVAVLEEEARVFDFQLRQTGPASLCLGLGPLSRRVPDVRENCRRALQALFLRQHMGPLRLVFEDLHGPALDRSGKLKRIVALPR